MSWDADSTVITLRNSGTGSCRMASATIVSDEKIQGSGSMRVTWDDREGDIGCRDVVPQTEYGHSLRNGTDLYYRWWMKIDRNFNWGDQTGRQKGKQARMKTKTDGVEYFTGYMAKDGVRFSCPQADCQPGFSGGQSELIDYDFNPDTNGGVTEWQEYIIHFKWQTGASQNAEFRFYVNGVEQGSITGWKFGADLGNAVQSYSNGWAISGQDQLCQPTGTCPGFGGFIWVDDISVDDVWNSTFTVRPKAPILSAVQ
jgi:hypothetical protein